MNTASGTQNPALPRQQDCRPWVRCDVHLGMHVHCIDTSAALACGGWLTSRWDAAGACGPGPPGSPGRNTRLESARCMYGGGASAYSLKCAPCVPLKTHTNPLNCSKCVCLEWQLSGFGVPGLTPNLIAITSTRSQYLHNTSIWTAIVNGCPCSTR